MPFGKLVPPSTQPNLPECLANPVTPPDNDHQLMRAFNHWKMIGYSVQSAMVMALAAHATREWTLVAACIKYVEDNTNQRIEDITEA